MVLVAGELRLVRDASGRPDHLRFTEDASPAA